MCSRFVNKILTMHYAVRSPIQSPSLSGNSFSGIIRVGTPRPIGPCCLRFLGGRLRRTTLTSGDQSSLSSRDRFILIARMGLEDRLNDSACFCAIVWCGAVVARIDRLLARSSTSTTVVSLHFCSYCHCVAGDEFAVLRFLWRHLASRERSSSVNPSLCVLKQRMSSKLTLHSTYRSGRLGCECHHAKFFCQGQPLWEWAVL
jgi:hypothetical protein